LNTVLAESDENDTLGNLISQQAYLWPKRVAVKFGQTTLSYHDLNARANKFAALLIQNGVKPGVIVGLAVDRSAEMLVALLAIIKAGGAYLPLDPGFPADRLNFMLADSRAGLLVTQKNYEHLFNTDSKRLFIEDALLLLDAFPATEPGVTISGHDVLYILYTSGSTGLPKGVLIEHHSMVNLLYSMQAAPGITMDDVWLAVTTISFDMAGAELYLPLANGATVLIADADMVKDGRILLEVVMREKVTIMQATPYTWRMMLAAGWDQKLPIKVLAAARPCRKKWPIIYWPAVPSYGICMALPKPQFTLPLSMLPTPKTA